MTNEAQAAGTYATNVQAAGTYATNVQAAGSYAINVLAADISATIAKVPDTDGINVASKATILQLPAGKLITTKQYLCLQSCCSGIDNTEGAGGNPMRKGGFAMRNIEKMIKENNRQEFYDYYLSIGYDHKTAAALAMFTYGKYGFEEFSMDKLYDALRRGEEYLPPEVIKERRRIRHMRESIRIPKGRGRSHSGINFSDDSMWAGGIDGSADADYMLEESATAALYDDFTEALPDCVPEPRSAGPARKAPSAAGPARKALSAAEEIAYSAKLSSPMLAKRATGYVPGLEEIVGSMGFATDEYEQIEEKDARGTASEPTSTFRMTTNTASAGVILNQLRNGRRIDRSMVRIEEMLNYFRYESEIPQNEMFKISHELMDAGDDRKYLYINVQGREEVREKQNIIILLDVSGSMDGNAEKTQAMIATIVSKLGNGDRLSLVTYSSKDRVVLEAFPVNGPEDRIHVLEKLLAIKIDGWTNGSGGIERAYEIGKQNYIEGGNNQVILITDGDLNFGITDKGGLEELIELKKKDNLFLSVIGTGLWNYKDDKLEVLCKHGNGVYRTVNNLTDVRKSIDEEYSSLVNIIAKDVKAQVEFNPEVVASYRLLGFENRTLAHEDFVNDKVISEPFGSGGYGVALYELTMKTGDAPVESGLKYSKLVTTGSKELGTVKVRYKEPLEDVSHEIEKVIGTPDAAYTDNLRLAFIVYVCAEKLRASDKISAGEIELARKLYKELGSAAREKNSADLFKLAGILEKSESELGIGIRKEPFPW